MENDLFEAICELPMYLKTPYLLMITGEKYENIAKQLNITKGAVSNYIFKARLELSKKGFGNTCY